LLFSSLKCLVLLVSMIAHALPPWITHCATIQLKMVAFCGSRSWNPLHVFSVSFG
jgi:hypothetical protein